MSDSTICTRSECHNRWSEMHIATSILLLSVMTDRQSMPASFYIYVPQEIFRSESFRNSQLHQMSKQPI